MTVNESLESGWNVMITHPLLKGSKYLKDYGDYLRGETMRLTSNKKKAQVFKYDNQAELAIKKLNTKFIGANIKIVKA